MMFFFFCNVFFTTYKYFKTIHYHFYIAIQLIKFYFFLYRYNINCSYNMLIGIQARDTVKTLHKHNKYYADANLINCLASRLNVCTLKRVYKLAEQ